MSEATPGATPDNHSPANGTLAPPRGPEQASVASSAPEAGAVSDPEAPETPEAPKQSRRQRWVGYLVGVLAVAIPGVLIYFLLARSMIWEVQQYDGPVRATLTVAFSADGQLVAAAGMERKLAPGTELKNIPRNPVWVWNTHTGQEVVRLKGHAGNVSSIVFLPGGKQLLSAGDDRVRLWDIESGKELGQLNSPTNWIRCLAVSPDGKTVATTCKSEKDLFIRLWDLPSRKQLLILPGHRDKVLCVAFTPDGRHLLSAGDTTVRLWELRWQDGITGADLLATGDQALLRRWPRRQGQHQEAAAAVARLTSPLGQGPLLEAALFAERPTLLVRTVDVFKGHTSGVTWVTIAPDGRQFASSSNDGTIRLWDLETKKEVQTFHGHKSPVSCLAFSPNGRLLASSSLGPMNPQEKDDGRSPEEPRTLRVWSLETGQECYYVDAPPHMIRSLAFAPGGGYLLTGGATRSGDTANGKTTLWRVP